MNERTCSKEGCGRPHKARGLCSPCYTAARKAGTLPPKRRGEKCTVDGCTKSNYGLGMCRPHYKQHKRETTPKDEITTWYVYALIGKDNVPRYIGSSKDPNGRAKKHYSDRNSTTRGNKRLYAWLRLQDEAPRVIVLQETSEDERFKAEAQWTEQFRSDGFDILNVNSGSKSTPENEAKMRAAQKRAVTGQPLSPERAEALRKVHLGAKRSDETRKKISDGLRRAHARRRSS